MRLRPWAALCGALSVPVFPALAQDGTMERGRYLVNAVMVCDGCHSPPGMGAVGAQRRFAGGPQLWDTAAYTVRGSNISSDKATGIGEWSVDDIKRALIDGVRPNGTPLSPQMPFAFYRIMTPQDIDAVATYIKSIPAVPNQVAAPIYKAVMETPHIPGAEKPMDSAAFADPVKRGLYLATIAHCMECHAKGPDGKFNIANGWGKGGDVMTGPAGPVKVSNITSHPTNGIGNWSDEEVKRALTHAVSRDGRPLKPPMARQSYFSQMTEGDLNAIVAWLRTLPPIE